MPNYIFAPRFSIRLRKGIDSSPPIASARDERKRRLHRFTCALPASLLVGTALTTPLPAQTEIPTEGPVTFERAFRIAVERSPQAQLLEARLEALEGEIDQALLKPNPVVGAELENVLGTGEFEGVNNAELTVGISQLFERREKRQARARLAESRQELLRWDYEETLSELRLETLHAFSAALVAQQNVELQADLLELARASEAEVERRAEAATASAIELSQARLATSRQRFQLGQAQRRLAEAKTALAALWSAPSAADFQLQGELELDPALPSLEELVELVDQAPSLARFEAERQVQRAAVEREQAEAQTDFELFGGVKYLGEGGDDAAFVLGVDIPWKIRDRNQGNIRSARAALQIVEARRRLAYRDAVAALAVAYREYKGAIEEWQTLSQQLLPAAEETLEETQEGYEQGAITLLNVLEARRALFEIRSEMLDATQLYLTAQATIEQLTSPTPQAQQ